MTTEMEFPEQALVNLIKRAMRGDERHQYTYSVMLKRRPERTKELLEEAKRQLEAEGETITWLPSE